MDSNSSDLLKDAVFEENAELRLLKISKAVKKITDILPFDKKNIILLDQPDLPQYLLLSIPLFGRSIIVILRSLIEKFYKNDDFLINLWKGLVFVVSLQDETPKNTIDKKAIFRKSVIFLGKMLILPKKSQKNEFSYLRFDFCTDLLLNKNLIKSKALDFARIIFPVLKIKQEILLEKINILLFFKLVLQNTFSDKLIVKACNILSELKSSWKSLWHLKNPNIDLEIEEILLSKSGQIFQSKLENIESENISPKNKEIVGDYSPSLEKQNDNDFISSKDDISEDENSKNLIEDKYADDFDDKSLVLTIQLETWLCNEENEILIGKNEYISEFFKLGKNFNLILAFILQPMTIICSNCWIKKYPTILTDQQIPIYFQKSQIFRGKQPNSNRLFNIFQLRSYKTMEMLCNEQNFSFIFRKNSEMLEIYYNSLSIALQHEDSANFNHIAVLTEFFLKKEQEISLNRVFSSNLLYNFALFLHFPELVRFLTIFLGNFHGKTFSLKNQLRIWKYCYFSGFFKDLSLFMLDSHIENFIFDKLKENYHPIDLNTILVSKEKEIKPEIKDYLIKKNENIEENPIIFEEYNGFRTDIDKIKEFCHIKKSFLMKKVVIFNKVGLINLKGKLSVEEMHDFLEKNTSENKEKPIKKANSIRITQWKKTVNLSHDFTNEKTLILKTEPISKEKTLKPLKSKENSVKFEEKSLKSRKSLKKDPFYLTEMAISEEKFSGNRLYPINANLLTETNVDREAKKPCFLYENIEKTEEYSILIAEMLFLFIENAIDNYNNLGIKKAIEYHSKDYRFFMHALIGDDGGIFTSIIKNYLFKSKLLEKNEVNSSYICGEIVNKILINLNNNIVVSPFSKIIHEICCKYFDFLCKKIIETHFWAMKPEITLQNVIIEDLLGSSRLLLLTTFVQILKNDNENNYSLLEFLSERFLHVIIIWFFEKQTNNFLQKLLYNFFEIIFKYGTEKLLISLIFKLNFLALFNEAYNTIYRNDVFVSGIQMESFFLFMGKIVILFENSLELRSEEFKNRVKGLCSWVSLLKIVKKSKKIKRKSIQKNEKRLSRRETDPNIAFNMKNSLNIEKLGSGESVVKKSSIAKKILQK